MKKITSIILLSAILLTGNIAFVQASTLTTTTAANYRAKLGELAPLQAKIRANRSEILALQTTANKAYNKAKLHIKSLSKNMDDLTPAQLESLEESLNSINQDKQALNGTIGEITKETLAFKTARGEKNFVDLTNSLNNIIAVENTRIEDLQTIISDLNKAAAL